MGLAVPTAFGASPSLDAAKVFLLSLLHLLGDPLIYDL